MKTILLVPFSVFFTIGCDSATAPGSDAAADSARDTQIDRVITDVPLADRSLDTLADQSNGDANSGDANSGDANSGDAAAPISEAQCQTAVDRMLTPCANESIRLCSWNALRAGCNGSLNREVLVAITDCFAGDSICRSIGDPGTDNNIACVEAALARGQSAMIDGLRTSFCGICPMDNCTTQRRNTNLFELSGPTALAGLSECIQNEETCDAVRDCGGQVSPWATVFACEQ